MDAERIEERVTRRIEEAVAENAKVEKVRSITRTGITYVYVELKEAAKDTDTIFDDIALKLAAITDLPDGAGPIQFIKDFGDTAALMLTVASPSLDDVEVSLRADQVRRAIERLRGGAEPGRRATLVCNFPRLDLRCAARPGPRSSTSNRRCTTACPTTRACSRAPRSSAWMVTDLGRCRRCSPPRASCTERLRVSEFHPDVWPARDRARPADDPGPARGGPATGTATASSTSTPT